jgi:hypothetical protein
MEISIKLKVESTSVKLTILSFLYLLVFHFSWIVLSSSIHFFANKIIVSFFAICGYSFELFLTLLIDPFYP